MSRVSSDRFSISSHSHLHNHWGSAFWDLHLGGLHFACLEFERLIFDLVPQPLTQFTLWVLLSGGLEFACLEFRAADFRSSPEVTHTTTCGPHVGVYTLRVHILRV